MLELYAGNKSLFEQFARLLLKNISLAQNNTLGLRPRAQVTSHMQHCACLDIILAQVTSQMQHCACLDILLAQLISNMQVFDIYRT